MEERRRADDNRLDEMMKALTESITESREYRAADTMRQGYFKETLEEVKTQVKKTNGRVDAIEDKIKEQEDKRKGNKDFWVNAKDFAMVLLTAIMAVSAAVIFFKK